MTWQQHSRRRTELPANWQNIRKHVLDRDGHTCTIRGPRCTIHATHVDHTDEAQGPHDHRPEVLRAACQTCHMGRTQAQSRGPSRRRKLGGHPGLL